MESLSKINSCSFNTNFLEFYYKDEKYIIDTKKGKIYENVKEGDMTAWNTVNDFPFTLKNLLLNLSKN